MTQLARAPVRPVLLAAVTECRSVDVPVTACVRACVIAPPAEASVQSVIGGGLVRRLCEMTARKGKV